VEPGGQDGLILSFGDLAPHHLEVQLRHPQGQGVAPPFEGFADTDDMAQELAFLPEVSPQDPIGQAAEQGDQAALGATTGVLGRERIGEGPVLVEVVERSAAPGLLAARGGSQLIRRQRLPPEYLVFFLQTLEKLFRVEPRFSHDAILLSLPARVVFTGRSGIVAVRRRWTRVTTCALATRSTCGLYP
jgi:hypothetical protein